MKTILNIFSLLIISGVINFTAAQNTKSTTATPADPAVSQTQAKDYTMINGERVYTKADVMPSFPGGEQAMFNFLHSNISYPDAAKTNKVKGRVFISFTIGRDGSVKNVTLRRGIGSGCDEEALRVINAMPKWTPGKKDGRPVAVQYSLPINFSLDNETQSR